MKEIILILAVVTITLVAGTAVSALSADINKDEEVNILDLVLIGRFWNPAGNLSAEQEIADINEDGRVDFADVEVWAKSYKRIDLETVADIVCSANPDINPENITGNLSITPHKKKISTWGKVKNTS